MTTLRLDHGGGDYDEWTRVIGGWRHTHRRVYEHPEEWFSVTYHYSDDAKRLGDEL